jgi:hypothetical protein
MVPVSSTKGTSFAADGEGQAAGERGDEPVAAQRHRGGIRAQRQAQHRGAGEPLRHPAAATGHLDQPAAATADPGPDQQAERQFGHRGAWSGAGGVLGGGRAGDGDQHERGGDPVVEPALDVDQPPDPGRDRPVDHHARAEGGIGRRERRADEQGEPDVAHPGQDEREQRAQADGQRQPDAQQPQAQSQVRPQLMQPDPGGVRE